STTSQWSWWREAHTPAEAGHCRPARGDVRDPLDATYVGPPAAGPRPGRIPPARARGGRSRRPAARPDPGTTRLPADDTRGARGAPRAAPPRARSRARDAARPGRPAGVLASDGERAPTVLRLGQLAAGARRYRGRLPGRGPERELRRRRSRGDLRRA